MLLSCDRVGEYQNHSNAEPRQTSRFAGAFVGIHAGLTQSWVFTGSRSAYQLEMSHSILWPFARLSGMIGGAVNRTSFWRSCNPGQSRADLRGFFLRCSCAS
ncbi:hypothetical protein DEA98_27240 [Brucella pseudogrignonensis]|nr:hypothetical protein [Brucella pseudogrignonensis]